MDNHREKHIRIVWESDTDKSVEFVNHVAVAFDGSMYTVRFYRVIPPGPDVDPDQLNSVPGHHVITLVITPTNMKLITEVFQNLLLQESE